MPPTKITSEQEKYIIKQYANGTGKFAKELARELECGHQVITNCLRRNNIKVVQRYDPQRGTKNGNWSGGIRMVGGYKYVYRPKHHLARKDGWASLHRMKMEFFLKRKITKKEVVHHKDGNRLNNAIDNLEIFKSNGHHLSEHSKSWKRDNSGRFVSNNIY